MLFEGVIKIKRKLKLLIFIGLVVIGAVMYFIFTLFEEPIIVVGDYTLFKEDGKNYLNFTLVVENRTNKTKVLEDVYIGGGVVIDEIKVIKYTPVKYPSKMTEEELEPLAFPLHIEEGVKYSVIVSSSDDLLRDKVWENDFSLRFNNAIFHRLTVEIITIN